VQDKAIITTVDNDATLGENKIGKWCYNEFSLYFCKRVRIAWSRSEFVLIALLTISFTLATVHGMRSNLDNPLLTYQDTLDVDFAVTHGLDFLTISYAAKASDIEEIR